MGNQPGKPTTLIEIKNFGTISTNLIPGDMDTISLHDWHKEMQYMP